MQENKYLLSDAEGTNDPIESALKKYAMHPSVLNIKKSVSESQFSFKEVGLSDVEDEIKNPNPKRVNTFKNIPPKILKENSDLCNNTILYQ